MTSHPRRQSSSYVIHAFCNGKSPYRLFEACDVKFGNWDAVKTRITLKTTVVIICTWGPAGERGINRHLPSPVFLEKKIKLKKRRK
jgi:hypothetical protein